MRRVRRRCWCGWVGLHIDGKPWPSHLRSKAHRTVVVVPVVRGRLVAAR